MRLRNLTLCVAVLLICGAPSVVGRAAGDGRATQNADAGAGQTVNVRVGQRVSVAARGLKIEFVAVREDSRCPEGVQCIWAGNARLALRLSRAGSRRTTNVELNTTTEPREIVYANYKIKLTNLAPRPVQDRPPRPRDYVATLVVSKNS